MYDYKSETEEHFVEFTLCRKCYNVFFSNLVFIEFALPTWNALYIQLLFYTLMIHTTDKYYSSVDIGFIWKCMFYLLVHMIWKGDYK